MGTGAALCYPDIKVEPLAKYDLFLFKASHVGQSVPCASVKRGCEWASYKLFASIVLLMKFENRKPNMCFV